MSEICEKIHKVMNDKNNLERYTFKDLNKIPKSNGIYIMFEKGERAHNTDRIVRIGVSSSLLRRLKSNHYKGNRDNSIFRYLIGDALLNEKKDYEYLEVWKKRKGKRKNHDKYNKEKDNKIEEEVSKYLKENIYFTFIEIQGKEVYEKYEKKLISTIAKCNECKMSENWLGKYSSEDKVRQFSLWNSKELGEEPFTEKKLEELIAKYINK